MDSHQGFDESGFLSEGITNGIAQLRAENADWFKLAEDMNGALMHTATTSMNTVKTSSWTPEAVAVRVLLRSCGTFQGVILLAERGMITEGRTLSRSLIENAFCMAALHDNAAAFVEMLKNDSEASRGRQARFIIAEELIAHGAARDKLQEAIDAIGRVQVMNLKEVSKLGPLNKQYLSYQRLSDGAAHPSARSLHRHIRTDPNGKGWNYKWGPGDGGDNATTLYHAILPALSIGIGITQMLKDMDNNAKFGDLSNRLQAMPPVPPV